jgi:alkylation response protein AidB-like acyl-CoA dehydrogenase
MDFDLSDDTRELRSVCKNFGDADIRPYAAQWSGDATFPAHVFRKLGWSQTTVRPPGAGLLTCPKGRQAGCRRDVTAIQLERTTEKHSNEGLFV